MVKTVTDVKEPRLIPLPRMGGSYAHCEFVTEIVKVRVGTGRSKKTVDEVHYCKFKTRNLARYRRHYLRRHGTLPAPVASLEDADAKIAASKVKRTRKATPKYAEGDSRRA